MNAPFLKPLWTYDEVVDALGGRNGVAKITRQPPHAIPTWRKQRGKFPSKYHVIMKYALKDAGYRAPPSLWGQFSEFQAFRGPKQSAA